MYNVVDFNHVQDYVTIENTVTKKVLQVSFTVIDNLRAKGVLDENQKPYSSHRTARTINNTVPQTCNLS